MPSTDKFMLESAPRKDLRDYRADILGELMIYVHNASFSDDLPTWLRGMELILNKIKYKFKSADETESNTLLNACRKVASENNHFFFNKNANYEVRHKIRVELTKLDQFINHVLDKYKFYGETFFKEEL